MKNVAVKMQILLVLAIVAVAGYFVWKDHNKGEGEKELERKTKALNKFNNRVQDWAKKIRTAMMKPTPGWENWYKEGVVIDDPATVEHIRHSAMWQVKINEPQSIPPGYDVVAVDEGKFELREV